MQTIFFRLTGCLLLPVLLVHNLFHSTPASGYMPVSYLLMHPSRQLLLVQRSAWWLTMPVLNVLFTAALM